MRWKQGPRRRIPLWPLSDGLQAFLWAVFWIGIIIILVITAGLWVDDAEAVRAAERNGLHDVRIIEAHHWMWFMTGGCDDETVATVEVVGLDADGRRIRELVCMTWRNEATIVDRRPG